jgi:hypothetical protein
MVFSSTISNNNLYCTAVIPKTLLDLQIAKKQAPLKNIALISAIAGILMAVFFSLKTYLPIYKLYKAIKMEKSTGDIKGFNELTNINDVLINTINENRRIGYIIQDVTKLIREQMLLMFLTGDINNIRDINNLMSAAQLNLPGPFFTVMRIPLPQGVTPQVHTDIARTIQESIVWHPGSVYALAMEQEPGITIICSLGPGPDLRSYQERLALNIQNLISSKFSFEVSVCMGKVYNNIALINKSYRRLRRRLKRRH